MLKRDGVEEMWTTGYELLIEALKPHPSFEKIAKHLNWEQFHLHLGIPFFSKIR
jgi:hypothetical protein